MQWIDISQSQQRRLNSFPPTGAFTWPPRVRRASLDSLPTVAVDRMEPRNSRTPRLAFQRGYLAVDTDPQGFRTRVWLRVPAYVSCSSLSSFLADRGELVDAIVDCVLIHKVTLRPPFSLLISPQREIFTIFDTLVSFSLSHPPVPFVLLQHWTAAVQFHTNTWIGALVICIRRSIVWSISSRLVSLVASIHISCR
jgi:hypothetical protein